MITGLQIAAGLAFLLIGGEALVRGAARIATQFGLSRLIVGMVIAGFGTSLPELVVSVRAVLADTSGLAVGNVVGSNIANILLILAVAALVRPIEAASRNLEPEGIVLIVITVGFALICLQGTVPRWQGGLMIALMVALVALRLRQEQTAARQRPATTATVDTVAPVISPGWPAILLIATGLAALPIGAELFVQGSTALAQILGVSDVLIGLTIVAVGTSLPELVTSVVAAARGEATIGYGNIVGSNLFNISAIFGCATLVGPMRIPANVVIVDNSVMIAATAVMLWFLATHARLTRGEAGLMLIAYIGYVAARYVYALN